MKVVISLLLMVSPILADQKVRDFWFAGAEISSFELSQSRYGQNHPGHAELIFVTEPFLVDELVKNESGKAGSTDVLKLNALTTFNTGFYSYRTMTSTFRPIDLAKFPHALKSTTSIQDWCGQAFQQFGFKGNSWEVELRSYFEKAGDQNFTLPGTYLEDELWVTLRLDPEKLPVGKVSVIPGAVFTRFAHQPIRASEAAASLETEGSTSVYTLGYADLGRKLSIRFDAEFPHVIREWTEETKTGTTRATLKKRMMNVDYWNLSKPSDASLRKKLGLEPVAD
ncbi:septum formation inhibitor Maf [Haloferula sp.]|uniref:septum formation inhibitor Maf n=1 Tax=Haloferula sp. TaxID=2497595 RepID=UPI003C759545